MQMAGRLGLTLTQDSFRDGISRASPLHRVNLSSACEARSPRPRLKGCPGEHDSPESLVGSAQMCASGRSRMFSSVTWSLAAALLSAWVVLGSAAFGDASDETISVPLAFAGGAVIASLADTLMPEAYRDGGPMVALATVVGFLLSYVLAPV